MVEPKLDYSSMSAEERIRLVERIFISYPRLNQVLEKIRYCHEASKLSVEPLNLLILGDTGTGKTTCKNHYEQKWPRRQRKGGTVVPVLSAAIPIPASVKSLVTELLLRLGDPLAERGSVLNQTHRIKLLLKSCQVELIMLDEFQHFIDRDSLKILQTVSDWLKDLLNETKIPLIGNAHSGIDICRAYMTAMYFESLAALNFAPKSLAKTWALIAATVACEKLFSSIDKKAQVAA